MDKLHSYAEILTEKNFKQLKATFATMPYENWPTKHHEGRNGRDRREACELYFLTLWQDMVCHLMKKATQSGLSIDEISVVK